MIIDVGNLVFTADMVPDGQEEPKAADAKARFDCAIQTYAPGSSHAELRKLMRAAWDLSQKVTHGDVTRVDAFAAAQVTVLIVRTLAEMQGEGRPGGTFGVLSPLAVPAANSSRGRPRWADRGTIWRAAWVMRSGTETLSRSPNDEGR